MTDQSISLIVKCVIIVAAFRYLGLFGLFALLLLAC